MPVHQWVRTKNNVGREGVAIAEVTPYRHPCLGFTGTRLIGGLPRRRIPPHHGEDPRIATQFVHTIKIAKRLIYIDLAACNDTPTGHGCQPIAGLIYSAIAGPYCGGICSISCQS